MPGTRTLETCVCDLAVADWCVCVTFVNALFHFRR